MFRLWVLASHLQSKHPSVGSVGCVHSREVNLLQRASRALGFVLASPRGAQHVAKACTGLSSWSVYLGPGALGGQEVTPAAPHPAIPAEGPRVWGPQWGTGVRSSPPPSGPPQICFLSSGKCLLLLLSAAVCAGHVSERWEPLGAARHPGTGWGLHQLPIPDMEPGGAPAVLPAPSRLHRLCPQAQGRSPQTGPVPVSRTREE